jgi:glycosyltransferase involved in cell wall biosynthesis
MPHLRVQQPRRIAIVVPALDVRGGLASVASFLHQTIAASERYEPQLFSLATSSSDRHSLRLLAPRTWVRGAQIVERRLGDTQYLHVGTAPAEIEPLRYRPRAELTRALEAFDLVQIVGGSPALAHIARDIRAPVVLQCATMVDVERNSLLTGWGPKTVWRRVMTRIVAHMDETGMRHADLIMVENAWMRDRVAEALGPDRVRFSPPGVDTTVFHPNGTPTDPVVLAVGRLDDPRKNIAMLMEAFAIVRREIPEARLVLAGERPPTEDLSQLSRRLGIAEAVQLRLALPEDELAQLYRGATVFALSSNEEGLGIVALEAMASGVPAVCTRCGGPETSVVDGETGYLVPVGDVAAFADRLGRLLSDRELRDRMSETARRHMEQHFSLERTGAHFLEAYDELLAETPSRERIQDAASTPAS